MTGQEWRLHAACRGSDLDMWTTPSRTEPLPFADQIARARTALAMCVGCPVHRACGEDAEQRGAKGVIRAGVAYNAAGGPSTACARCGFAILGRHRRARFCSDTCQTLAEYQAARQERLTAA